MSASCFFVSRSTVSTLIDAASSLIFAVLSACSSLSLRDAADLCSSVSRRSSWLSRFSSASSDRNSGRFSLSSRSRAATSPSRRDTFAFIPAIAPLSTASRKYRPPSRISCVLVLTSEEYRDFNCEYAVLGVKARFTSVSRINASIWTSDRLPSTTYDSFSREMLHRTFFTTLGASNVWSSVQRTPRAARCSTDRSRYSFASTLKMSHLGIDAELLELAVIVAVLDERPERVLRHRCSR